MPVPRGILLVVIFGPRKKGGVGGERGDPPPAGLLLPPLSPTPVLPSLRGLLPAGGSCRNCFTPKLSPCMCWRNRPAFASSNAAGEAPAPASPTARCHHSGPRVTIRTAGQDGGRAGPPSLAWGGHSL